MQPERRSEEWQWQDSLYDHYKDTFHHIRERELRRDREFLIVIAVLGFLAVAIAYTSALSRALAGATLIGIRVDLSTVPAPAVLTAVWVLTFVLSMRYCQNCINVERQYSYLHQVEEQLGTLVGDSSRFSREGRAYLDDYPRFSDWVWFVYVYVFPLIVLASAVLLVVFEWMTSSSAVGFKISDSVLAFGVSATFFFYRLLAPVQDLLAWARSKLDRRAGSTDEV